MLINQDPQWNGVAASEIQIFPDLEPIDADCSLLSDDLFQTLSSELGIPLLLEDEIPLGTENNYTETSNDVVLGTSLPGLEDLNVNLSKENADLDFGREIKDDIKLEPASPYTRLSLSPTLSYADSNSSGPIQDVKPMLETPPISPPVNVSPPISPEPVLNGSLMERARLIPLERQDVKCAKYIFSKANSAKRVRVQPKNEHPRDVSIVLSTQEFAALTEKVKQNYLSYPLTSRLLPTNGRVLHKQVKFEPDAIQQQNHVKIIGNLSDVCTAENESTVRVSDAPLIVKNGQSTSIIVKNEPLGRPPIVIKTERPSYTPIVIKNESQEPGNLTGRQECEIKALKRQQRMIKNRESACLSRKKKKEYVSALEKQISDLQEENKQLKLENTSLRQRLSTVEETAGASNKLRNTSLHLNVNKKNTAILLGMVFFVSLNIHGFGNILSGMQTKRFDGLTKEIPAMSSHETPYVRHGRTLLWTDSTKDRVQDNFRASFQKNANESMQQQLMCPMHINQSESIRLDYELRRWIGGESEQDRPRRTKSNGNPSIEFLSLSHALQKKVKSKHRFSQKSKLTETSSTPISNINAVQLFSPVLKEHASLFEALGRRDDTFYVVWFSGEHLLLPASRKNSTGRPRMSLVLPAVPINETLSTPANRITMMQIDCEVTNTQLLHLHQSVIPNHLRTSNGKPEGNHDPRQAQPANDISDGIATNSTKNYKPYFMKENEHKIYNKKNLKDIYVNKSNVGDYNKETGYMLKEKFFSDFHLDEINSETLPGLRKTEEIRSTGTLKKKRN